MHIVAMAWLYVTLLMAMTEPNLTAAVLSWFLFGLMPLAGLVWIWLKLRPRRSARRGAAVPADADAAAVQSVCDAPDRNSPS